jgi:serine protease AprX
MRRGVVWTGRSRCAAVTVGLAVGLSPLAVAGPAWAGEAPAPKPVKGAAKVVGTIWGDATADAASLDPTVRKYDPKRDTGSLFTVTNAIGARSVWGQKDASGRAITGQGVTVAVVDSGVAAVPGLNGPGKIMRGPDLSLETNSTTALSPDTFGHGTHMASIIAGRDAVATDPNTGAPKAGDATAQLGVAPDAKLLALKLATTDGSTDVSQVIAGLDWVVQHRNDNGMAVRVVNLSFGTDSVQPYQVDPLAAAAENAWRHGIVVVVSGGNDGADAGGLSDPAIDPYVIAVGASDPGGVLTGWKLPTAASFSSRGTTARHVDLLAPGRSIVGLRDPGSFVDVNHPEGLVAGDTTGRLFRGSGTSQAAAVVSGAAALLLQAQPGLTPDAVKAALVGTATPLPLVSRLDGGAGELDVSAALVAANTIAGSRYAPQLLGATRQWFPVATGTGSLDAARGSNHLVDAGSGAVLSGEIDVQGRAWDPAAWASASSRASSWQGGLWMGARWSGDAWTSSGWASARWRDASWDSARWRDASWDSARWRDTAWS